MWGLILCVAKIPLAGVGSVAELRAAVDATQIALLGEVIAWIKIAGHLPPGYRQNADDGRQYFRMHADLKQLLEEKLARKS